MRWPVATRAICLTRAFGFYFELINLAETNHRKRRRLALPVAVRCCGPAARLPGAARWVRMQRRGHYDADEALEMAAQGICVVPVFTAHPTEIARRSVMFKRRRISDLLEQLDRVPLPQPAR